MRSSLIESQSLSLRKPWNCTNILYCDELSKCVCTVRFWVCPDRVQLLIDQVECLSGSLWIMECISLAFRCGRCTRRSHPVAMYCLAIVDQRNFLLNVLELLGSTWIHWMNKDSSGIETFSLVLLLLARQFSQSSTVHGKLPTNFTLNSSIRSSNRTAPSSSRKKALSCRSNLIMNFDTAKQLWLNFAGLLSIHILSRTGT